MARAWRIEYEGALYHVLLRGNERQNIVSNDEEHRTWEDLHHGIFMGTEKFVKKIKKTLSSGYTPY